MKKFAEKELNLILKNIKENENGDGLEAQEWVTKNILDLIEVFDRQGHSGMSGAYVLRMFTRLANFKPVAPLTGEEGEWAESFGRNTQQNKRCSSVFRENGDNSTAYDIDGKIFSDDGGKTWYSGKGSFTPVTFPYFTPDEPERIILEEGFK